MSKEAALAFRSKVSQNPELQAQVRRAIEAGQGLDEAVRLGDAAGFKFSEEEAQQVIGHSETEELSDFELAMVAGGAGKGNPLVKPVPKLSNTGKLITEDARSFKVTSW